MLESLVQEALDTKSRVQLHGAELPISISTSTCQAKEAGSIAGQGREEAHVRYRFISSQFGTESSVWFCRSDSTRRLLL